MIIFIFSQIYSLFDKCSVLETISKLHIYYSDRFAYTYTTIKTNKNKYRHNQNNLKIAIVDLSPKKLFWNIE